MCKKYIKILLFFLALMIMTGCSSPISFSDKDMDIYEKTHKKYINMESYSAEAIMTVYSNKTENKYKLSQYVKEPGMYKTVYWDENGDEQTSVCEINGKITISSDAGESVDVQVGKIPDCTYVNNFFKLYYKSLETSITVNGGDNKTIVFETDIFPISQNAKKAVLKTDSNSDIKSITIYDIAEKPYVNIEFTKFNYNEKLSDEMFKIR